MTGTAAAGGGNGKGARGGSVVLVGEAGLHLLEKVTGLIRRRGFRVRSLSLGGSEDPALSRLHLVLDEDAQADQLVKNLNKLLEVRRVHEVSRYPAVVRELALIKVNVTPGTREEVLHVVRVFRGHVVDLTERTMTIEASGRPDKIDALQGLLRKHGIREMVRTGPIALVRGAQQT